MYQKERLDAIMALLCRDGYLTVKFLSRELDYSTATINRDLNLLEQQQKVHRTYGGVEAITTQEALPYRYEKLKSVKKSISRAAAELIGDGDTVFVDGATTTQYLGPYLAEKRDLTVISNNLSLITYLAERGVRCRILGGEVAEAPSMTDGADTVCQLMSLHADVAVFTSGSFTEDGKICSHDLYYQLHRAMLACADRTLFLTDHNKLNVPYSRVICHMSEVDAVISDYVFSNALKAQCPSTVFVSVSSKKSEEIT